MKQFRLPDLGEGLEDAEIISWHVSVGDRVVADQPLVSVETDKAVVEVPAPWSGTITELHAEPGETVRVGAPLADFDDGDTARSRDKGAIVGELEPPVRSATEPQASARSEPAPAARETHDAHGGVRAAPAVRARAAAVGVDLALIEGTGPDGSITLSDIAAYSERELPERTLRPGFEPLHGARRAMARNMTRSGATVVPASVTDVADVESWCTPEADVTARLMRAICVACEKERALNAWYDGVHEARKLHSAVDLGFAVDTGEGLFVPVIRDAGAKDVQALRAAIDKEIAAVRDRTITREAMADPTIGLSNFGAIGGRYAGLVLVPPQVAILGAGRLMPALVMVDGKAQPRLCLPLTLTFDHRAVTGGEAARFLMTVIADLTSPA